MAGKRLLAVMAVLAVACGGSDVAQYEAVLDELAIPAGWELVHTRTSTPDTEPGCTPIVIKGCPSVSRFYLVDGEPNGAYPVAMQIVLDAGYANDQETGPDCDGSPGGPACFFYASRGNDFVRVRLFNSGDDVDGLGIAEADRSLVLITAQGE